MKKALFFLTILAVLCMGAKIPPIRQLLPKDIVKLTIVNKSEMKVGVQLMTQVVSCSGDLCNSLHSKVYYMSIPKGDKVFPKEQSYEIETGKYQMNVFYLETYDPVYGYECKYVTYGVTPQYLLLLHNTRMIVFPCRKPVTQTREGNFLKLPFIPKLHFPGYFLQVPTALPISY